MRTRAACELLWWRHGGRRHGGGVCLAPSMRGAACTNMYICMHVHVHACLGSRQPAQPPTAPEAHSLARGRLWLLLRGILSNPLKSSLILSRREKKTRGCSTACTPATRPTHLILRSHFDLASEFASQVGLSSTPLLTQASERDLAGRKMAAELISSRRVRESHRAVSR